MVWYAGAVLPACLWTRQKAPREAPFVLLCEQCGSEPPVVIPLVVFTVVVEPVYRLLRQIVVLADQDGLAVSVPLGHQPDSS